MAPKNCTDVDGRGMDAAAAMAGSAIGTRQASKLIGGVQTDLCVLEFSDRFVVFLTQLNKPGTMVRAARPDPRRQPFDFDRAVIAVVRCASSQVNAFAERGHDGVATYEVQTLMVGPPSAATTPLCTHARHPVWSNRFRSSSAGWWANRCGPVGD